jgi:hypothetical protein
MAHPVIEGVAESSLATAGTSHPVTLPASIAESDLVLILMDIGSTSATLNALTDWTESLDEAVANGLKIIRYTGAGVPSEPTFVTTASTRSAQFAYRISGADKSIAPQIGTTATGTSATPNPPSVTPTGGVSKDYLSIPFYGAAGEELDDDTWSDTPPSGWSPTPPRQKSCGTAGTNLGGLIAAAERAITQGTAIDPGTFAKDVSAAWRAQHVLIHPLATPVFDLRANSWRVRNDDGSEDAATWKAAQNVNPTWVRVDEPFRLRFRAGDIGGASGTFTAPTLEYQVDGGGWNAADGTAVAGPAASAHFTDGAATTEQLTGGDAGSFVAGTMDEVDGVAANVSLGADGNTEVEFCLSLISGDLLQGQTIEFRVTTAGTPLTETNGHPTFGVLFGPEPAAFTTSHGPTTTPRDIVVTGCLDGDLLLVLGQGDGGVPGDTVTSVTTTTQAGSTGSWTEHEDTSGDTNECWLYASSAEVTADGSVTVRMARAQSGTVRIWGFSVLRLRGHGGVGVSAVIAAPGSAEVVSLAGVSQGSLVAAMMADWSANAVATGWAPSAGAVLVYRTAEGDATFHTGYWPGQASGTRDYGTTGSSGTDCTVLAVEVLAAGGGTTFPVDVGGAITPTGTLTRQPNKRPAGTVTPAGALSRRTDKTPTGIITPAGALLKRISRTLTGQTTPTGTVVTIRTKLLTFAGTITPTGALSRALAKLASGSVAPSGALAKQLGKRTTGTITPTSVLTQIRTRLVAFAGQITPAGTLSRRVSKTLLGGSTPAGTLTKQTARRTTGTITPTGTTTRSLVRQIAVGGAITPAGVLRRQIGKALGGTLSPTGALLKLISRILGGTVEPLGDLVLTPLGQTGEPDLFPYRFEFTEPPPPHYTEPGPASYTEPRRHSAHREGHP